MGKLQMINKENGNNIYQLYPPRELVMSLGWDKGQELEFEIRDGELIVRG